MANKMATMQGCCCECDLTPDFTFASSGTQLGIAFTDTSSGGCTATSWLWDFGDGTTSTDQNPTHTFVKNSDTYIVDYEVTLQVCCASCCKTVTQTVRFSYSCSADNAAGDGWFLGATPLPAVNVTYPAATTSSPFYPCPGGPIGCAAIAGATIRLVPSFFACAWALKICENHSFPNDFAGYAYLGVTPHWSGTEWQVIANVGFINPGVGSTVVAATFNTGLTDSWGFDLGAWLVGSSHSITGTQADPNYICSISGSQTYTFQGSTT